MAILGILAAVAIPQYAGYQATAKMNAAKTNHTTVVNFIKNSFANCSGGTGTITMANASGASVSIACSAVTSQNFIDNFVGNRFQNPYDATDLASSFMTKTAAKIGETGIVGSVATALVSGSTVVVTTISTGAAVDLTDTITVE